MFPLYGYSRGNANRDPVCLAVLPLGNIRSFGLCGDSHLPSTGRRIHAEVEVENQYEFVTVTDRTPMRDWVSDQYHSNFQSGSQSPHGIDRFITIDRS